MNRSKKDGYFENHHIHPKSLGGSLDKSNMVLLTVREHVLCHRLLIRMLERGTREWCSMVFAFKRMIDWGSKHGTERKVLINVRLLEERRRLHGEAMRIINTGKKHTVESKAKMSRAKAGVKLKPEHRSAIGTSLTKTLSTPEQRAKISAERKTRVHSDEHKSRTASSMMTVWAQRAERNPKPTILPGRNTPEERKALGRHLVSMSQKGKVRYIPTEAQRLERSKTMARVWAERKAQT